MRRGPINVLVLTRSLLALPIAQAVADDEWGARITSSENGSTLHLPHGPVRLAGTQRRLNELHVNLHRAGIRLRRIPARLVSPSGSSENARPFAATYNNVLLEELASGPVVYLPQYGIAPLDQQAAQVYQDAGIKFAGATRKTSTATAVLCDASSMLCSETACMRIVEARAGRESLTPCEGRNQRTEGKAPAVLRFPRVSSSSCELFLTRECQRTTSEPVSESDYSA